MIQNRTEIRLLAAAEVQYNIIIKKPLLMGWMVNGTLRHPQKSIQNILKCKLIRTSKTVTRQKTFKAIFKNWHRRCTNNIITETVPRIDTAVSKAKNMTADTAQ